MDQVGIGFCLITRDRLIGCTGFVIVLPFTQVEVISLEVGLQSNSFLTIIWVNLLLRERLLRFRWLEIF